MGLLLIMLILSVLAIIYLYFDTKDRYTNIVIFCLSVLLTGVLIVGIAMIVGNNDNEFFRWLNRRESCESHIENFEKYSQYQKLKVIHEIENNNETLEMANGSLTNWLFKGFYNEKFQYFKPLEVPKYNLNSRKEETK